MCKLQSLPSSSNYRVMRSSRFVEDDDDHDVIGSAEICVSGAEPSSACLWAMVTNFLEVDGVCADQIASRAGAFSSDTCSIESSDAFLKKAIQEMETIFGESSVQEAEEAKISICVAKALKSKSSTVGAESAHNEQALSAVLKHLQREGYDAGLCVTARKPGNAAGLPPTGGHRYIDVILEQKPAPGSPLEKRRAEKLIVDVGFSAHFEIARALPAYRKLTAVLPSTFIGKSALLQRVVRIMSQAAKASLESQGMAIPPWRSYSFLLAKWLSPAFSRIISLEKAEDIIFDTSSTNHGKPRVLAELNYNADLANVADSFTNDNTSEIGTKAVLWEEGAAKAWYPPPPTNQVPMNFGNADTSSTYTKARRQASVVSALALAFAETQRPHILCVGAATEKKGHNIRPRQSAAAAVSVL